MTQKKIIIVSRGENAPLIRAAVRYHLPSSADYSETCTEVRSDVEFWQLGEEKLRDYDVLVVDAETLESKLLGFVTRVQFRFNLKRVVVVYASGDPERVLGEVLPKVDWCPLEDLIRFGKLLVVWEGRP